MDDIRGLLGLEEKPTSKRAPLPSQEEALAAAGLKAAPPTMERKRGRDRDDDEGDYDRFVRELAGDRRAKPTDRTKTEEEIAVDEKARLEKLEVFCR